MAGLRIRAVPLAIALLAIALVSCEDPHALDPKPAATPASAAAVTFRTADGQTLDGRLWQNDPTRILIYLHEYREDQTRWWPVAEEPIGGQPSMLAFDFRGHGASTGAADDLAGMTQDVRAAIQFARGRGFQRVALMGAGMGAAAGMVAVAHDPSIGVIGLSMPIEFGGLNPLEVAPLFAGRLVVIAAEADVSARYSFEQLIAAAQVPPERRDLVKGHAHGVDLLAGSTGFSVRRFYEKALPGLLRR